MKSVLAAIKFTRPRTLGTIPNITKHHYATHSVRQADYYSTDPQALYNNPPNAYGDRHLEIHRDSCTDPACKSNDCPKLCDSYAKTEATGHFTHGYSPPHEVGKTNIVASPTDLNGDNKQQNAVMYDKPHDTPVTAEHVNGTNKLNNDAQMRNTIIQNESKK